MSIVHFEDDLNTEDTEDTSEVSPLAHWLEDYSDDSEHEGIFWHWLGE